MASRLGSGITAALFALLLILPSTSQSTAVHTFDCKNCHIPSLSVTQLGGGNVCLRCHFETIDGSDSILSDGTLAYVNSAFNPMDASNAQGNNPTYYNASGLGQTSHNWGAFDTQPRAGAVAPAPAQFYSRYGSSTGKVTCSRCHNPHGTRDNPQLLILGAGSSQQMCLACHAPWNQQGTDKTNITHPVGIDYIAATAPHAGSYNTATLPEDDGDLHTPGSVSLFDGKIMCGTCHQAHFADSNAATADTPENFQSLSMGGGDGKLLRGDGAGRANNSGLCQRCHTYQAHGDDTGEQVGCLVCHGGHANDDPSQPNYFMLRKSATTTTYNTVDGLEYSSATVLDPLQKSTWWNDGADGMEKGYCEKCHGDAIGIGSGAGSYHVASAICTDCHLHGAAKGAFTASCDACHGMPPVANTSTSPGGLVNKPGTTGSNTAGAHTVHAVTKQYPCGSCHADSIGSGPNHNNGSPQSISIGFSLFDDVYRGGSYDGQAGVSYDSSQADTTVTSGGAKTCANVYCHGGTMATNGGTNRTPAWDTPATGSCGKCHGATATNSPQLGSHRTHVMNDTWTYDAARFNPPNAYIYGRNLACTTCHNTNATTHVNGQADWSFNASEDARLTGATYKGSSSGVSATVPGAYGKCANLYCHSIAQTSTGGPLTGLPGEYQNPTWGTLNEGTCGSCHDADQGHAWFANRGSYGNWAPYISSGSHAKHLQSLAGPDPVDMGKCAVCHNYVGSDSLSSCASLCHNRNDLHVNHEIDVKFPPTLYGATAAYSGTPAPGDGYGSCASTYCHGNYPGSGRNATPSWGDASTAACGSCHGGSNSDQPDSGSHRTHTYATGYSISCTACHSGTVSGTEPYTMVGSGMHGNGKIDWAFDPSDSRFTGSVALYNVATGTAPPSDGTTPRAYNTCENIYCHSNAQPDGGIGKPDSYAKPVWGSGADLGCGSCHKTGTHGDTGPSISSGSHAVHLAGNTSGVIKCMTCHRYNTTLSGSENGCQNCHAPRPSDTSSLLFDNHVDGKVTINFDPILGDSGSYDGTPAPGDSYGRCSNISCHGSGTPQWGGTVACGDCHAATAGALTTGSHAAHLTKLNGPDGVVGSTLNCDGCHGSGAELGTHTGHVNGVTTFADGNALAATNACNTCHSPAGSYDGVNDAVVGAKDNWHTGIYTDGNLIAGKERWCVTCHDESPANSKADGTGVSARNMVGNNSTWGFYQTGHGADIGVDCVQCHSTRMPHIDHIYTPVLDVLKTTQNPNNYRFYVGKGMRMPYDGTSAPESRELCISCHSETTLYKQSGLPANATTNFRSDSADGTGYQNLHFGYHREGSNCITCHDPHGTSAPRMTADDRIGRFRLITLNAGDGKYYELSNRALWNSAANNHGGASTGPASCGTCHGYVTLSAGASEPTSTMYQRLLVPISFQTVTDLDTDGLPDTNDNCPAVSNAGQADTDGDGVGDGCDNSPGGFDPSNRDRDYDGIGDVSDTCPDDPNNDIDGDGVCIGAGFAAPKIGGNDNCPVNANPTQGDNDGDGHPDACDNCPSNTNADQSDYDLDGIGDACDASCDSFRNVWSQFLYPPAGAFTGLALDASDNVYGAGYVSSALPGLTYVGGYKDLAIVKYDKNGNLLAKAEFGSPDDGWEGLEDIAVDKANGFVYAAGYTTGSLPGHTNLGSSDMVLAKYDTDLNQIWAKQIATAAFDHGYALAIDASGNLYVGAKIFSQCTLVKYDPAGNELWNKPLGGTTGSEITSVAVDEAYVYAGGAQAGNVVVKQFGLDGTVGWSSQQGTAGTEAATSIVVTGSNVFVSGTTFGSFPGFTLEGTQDIFVLKLNKTDGSLMAATQFNAPDSQNARGIDTDSTGTELYVTGSSWNGFLAPNPGGQYDAFLLSFDTDLNVLRRRQIADTLSNENADIAVSKLDGSIYMAGARNNSGNFSLLKEQKGCP